MSDATVVEQAEPGALTRSWNLYGWVMVGAGALAMVATLPGRTHGLGMITERLLQDESFGLTRMVYGQMNLWATLLGALFCIGIGNAIDRFGLRLTLAAVMFPLAAVVLGMAWTHSLPVLFLLILLTRGFGQSALSVVSISMVGKWFDRNVSLPMAVYSILMAGGFMAAAELGRQYANLNWRDLWSVLGWSVLGLAVMLTLLTRDRKTLPPAAEEPQPVVEAVSFTQGEAMRTPMFWVCSLGISLYGMIASGISLFNESILVDQGFAKEVYYESMKIGLGIGVLAKLGAGVLGIYLPVNRLLFLSLALLASSLVLLTQLGDYRDVVGYVTVSALAGGMLTVLFFSAWPDLYGRAHLGKIQGSAQMMTVLASAFGPMIFAWTKERTDSYLPLIWALAGISAATALVAWVTPLPRKQFHST